MRIFYIIYIYSTKDAFHLSWNRRNYVKICSLDYSEDWTFVADLFLLIITFLVKNWNLGAAWPLVGLYPNIPVYSSKFSIQCLPEESWHQWIYQHKSALTNCYWFEGYGIFRFAPASKNNSKYSKMEYFAIIQTKVCF